ncbi:conserved hypothetical protein [Cupriavidus taiwanensis]|nr:conserved hypothetical protein [Cupriavidus taiwanensis]
MLRRDQGNMQQREHELLALAAAEAHLSEGRERIRRQIALVRELRVGGNDTALALRLLHLLRESVAVERHHRNMILLRLSELEGRVR